MLPKLIAGLSGPALMTLVGWSLVAGMGALRGRSTGVRLAYSFLIGQALLAIALWALSFAGWVRLGRTGILTVAAILLALAAFVGLWRRRSRREDPEDRDRSSSLRLPLGAPAALMALVAVIGGGLLLESVSDPVDDFDGRMTWATQARFLFAEGSVLPTALTDDDFYVTHPRYPLLMPIGQVVSLALARESLRIFSAGPLYALFYPVLLALVFDGARRLAGRRAATLATLLAALLPMVTSNPEGGAAGVYSDLPLGCFLGAGLLLALERRYLPAHALLAGLLIAAATLCKNEGLLLGPIALLGALLARERPRRQLLARSVLGLLPVGAAIGLLLAWRERIPNRFDEAYFENLSLERVFSNLPGNLLVPAGEAVSMLFRFGDWGLFWPTILVACLLGARELRRRSARPLLIAAALPLGIAGAAYALNPDLALVQVTWNRFLTQVLVPILLLSALVLRGSRRRLSSWGSLEKLKAIRGSIPTWEPSSVSPSLGGHLLAALVLSALTALALPEALRGFKDAIGPDWGDPLLNLYFLKWGARQIGLGMPDFWSAPFFHPTQGTMTLSDHLLGPAAVTWVLGQVGVGPIAAYNFLFLFSFAASGFATYWVLARSGMTWVGALFGGIALAFTHFRFDQLSHLQVLLMQWIPLALWSFDRLLERPTRGRAALFFALYAAQVTGGTYLAYMLHFPLAVLAANRLADGPSRARLAGRRELATLMVTVLLCLALAFSLFSPYARFADSLGIQRQADDIRPYAAVTWSWLTPTGRSLADHLELGPPYRGENGLFPGLLPILFAAIGLPLLWRRSGGRPWRDLPERSRRLALVAISLCALGLALADFHTLTGEEPAFRLWGLLPPRYNGPSILLVVGLGLLGIALGRDRPGTAARPLTALPGSGSDRIWLRGLLLTGAVSMLLCHPAIFFALRSWVPGMDGMRVPQRFWAFALPAVALAAATGLDAVSRTLGKRAVSGAFGLAACALLALELAPSASQWQRIPSDPELPRAMRFLRDDPAVRAILVLPLFGDPREAETMFAATSHWKPIANGYSGFLPLSYRRLQRLFSPFPEVQQLPELRRLGITHLQVQWDRFSPGLRPLGQRWIAACEHEGKLRLVYQDDQILVYEITGE